MILLAIACKSPLGENKSDPANGTGSTDNWAFTLSASKAAGFTIAQASTDTVIVTITRTGGFTGAVTLTPVVPGSGFTVTVENITTSGVVTTARVLIAVPGSFGPITGVGFGIAAQPASANVQGTSINLTFSVVRKNGTFINAPGAMSVGRGQSLSARISIIRTNYTVSVPMNLVFAPAGVTATFSPNPVVDTVTQMTLVADASVPEGVYNIGIRANEGTTFQGTAPVVLTVTAPASIALSFPTNPIAVVGTTPVPTQVNISRTNYTGAITFFTNPTPGLTVAFSSPVAANVNILPVTLTAAASLAAGTYTVMFSISAPGVPNTAATLTVNVSK